MWKAAKEVKISEERLRGKINFRGRGYRPCRLRLLPHYQDRQGIRKRETSITTKRDTQKQGREEGGKNGRDETTGCVD